MVKRFLGISVAALMLAAPAWASQEELAKETKPFQVTYGNGVTERYIVEWRALLDVDKSESGGPAVPFKGKFVDDRQCHWTVRGSVVRRVFLANQAGELFEKKDLAVVYDSSSSGEGAHFKLIGLRGENCNDANARFESDVNNGRIATRGNLSQTINQDVARVREAMKSWPSAVKVSAQ